MDKDSQHRQCRSRTRETGNSSPTQRATKRDRSRTARLPLSPRIDEFARQLARQPSASSTSKKRQTSRGATTGQTVEPTVSNMDVGQPSSSTQQRERRHSSTASVTRGTSPRFNARITSRKACEVCGEVMYTKNWFRHLERCHKNTETAATVGATSGDQPGCIALVKRGSRQRACIDSACSKLAVRRCVNRICPLECLNVPTDVQMSYAGKQLAGMSRHDRWMCVSTVNVLMSKLRSEMSMALPLMESRHFARPRPKLDKQNPEAGSEVGEHTQVVVDVHSDPAILDNTSQIPETASHFRAVEHAELLGSINIGAELPQLSGEDVERNLPETEEKAVEKPSDPYEIIRQRYTVKRTNKQLLEPLGTSSESQLVDDSRGSAARNKSAAEAVVTSSQLTVAVGKPSQPVQCRATVMHRVTSQKAASSAARVNSWQEEREKRGRPRPRGAARRSTISRSPARECHGYPRRDARWECRYRSPRRVEHRATPRPSPGRRLQHERGREESRRDDRMNREREPVTEDANKRLFAKFLSFINRRLE